MASEHVRAHSKTRRQAPQWDVSGDITSTAGGSEPWRDLPLSFWLKRTRAEKGPFQWAEVPQPRGAAGLEKHKSRTRGDVPKFGRCQEGQPLGGMVRCRLRSELGAVTDPSAPNAV